MTKLTEKHHALLTNAATQDGLILPIPETLGLSGAALTRTLNTLESKGVIARDGEAADAGFRITEEGRELVAGDAAAAETSDAPISDDGPPARPGSKKAKLIALLRTDDGVPLDTLTEETGWLPHTVRAALTGLRKQGLTIERGRDHQGVSTWRIAA